MLDAPFVCPPAITQLSHEVRSRYADNSQSSIIDPARSDAYDAAIAPMRAARKSFAEQANHYLATGERNGALKLGKCLEHWAEEHALTRFYNHGSRMLDKANHSIQQFNLSLSIPTIAMSYAQVKAALPLAQRETIEQWLREINILLADPIDEAHTRNNHAYWIAAAHAASGYTIDDKTLFDKGYRMAMRGIESIDDDLIFPAEALRGERALDYQYFAALPLIMVAEMALTRGYDMYGARDGILKRVMNERLIPGLAGDKKVVALLEARSGAKQIPIKQTHLLALAIYHQRFPDAHLEEVANRHLQFLAHTPPAREKEEISSLLSPSIVPTLNDLFYPEIGGRAKLVYPLKGKAPQ